MIQRATPHQRLLKAIELVRKVAARHPQHTRDLTKAIELLSSIQLESTIKAAPHRPRPLKTIHHYRVEGGGGRTAGPHLCEYRSAEGPPFRASEALVRAVVKAFEATAAPMRASEVASVAAMRLGVPVPAHKLQIVLRFLTTGGVLAHARARFVRIGERGEFAGRFAELWTLAQREPLKPPPPG